ncbi:MAG: hypothetical protein HZB80_06025 [Deltaproteobacteria bacterium]|nr:hypothetical protein [Deltaproteobacteria bacterium]
MIYTFLNLAEDILKTSDKPLTYQEIWEKGNEHNLHSKVRISGKTPWQTLGARLYVDVKDNEKSIFVKVGKNPAKFFLKSRIHELPKNIEQIITREDLKPKKEKDHFDERDLHPLVTYFAYANPSFNRGRNIFTKTIYHEKSKKTGLNEWVHPDLVGFYLPLDDWNPHLIEFNRISDNNVLKIFSFEVKKSLNRSNYRESYFQAVSNSSWANEGYLIAADITEDDDLLAELERLTMSFGIGIIKIDLDDFDSSSVLFPARIKPYLDWETMNKLCEQNTDFQRFIQDVKIDFESKRIHKSEYDSVVENPENHIKEIRNKTK